MSLPLPLVEQVLAAAARPDSDSELSADGELYRELHKALELNEVPPQSSRAESNRIVVNFWLQAFRFANEHSLTALQTQNVTALIAYLFARAKDACDVDKCREGFIEKLTSMCEDSDDQASAGSPCLSRTQAEKIAAYLSENFLASYPLFSFLLRQEACRVHCNHLFIQGDEEEADLSFDQQFLMDAIDTTIEDERLKEIVTSQVLDLKSKLSLELVAHKKRLEAKIARELDRYKLSTEQAEAKILV